MTVAIASLSLAFALFVSSPALAEEQASNVLAPGNALPNGFVSLQASGPPGAQGQQIEASYRDPSSGVLVRYTTARGSMADVEPGEPVHPIDVCIRDGQTGDVLIGPQVFADRPLTKGCGDLDDEESEKHGEHEELDVEESADFARKRQAALNGLEALKTVHFKSEYEPEREDLIAQIRAAAIPEELLDLQRRGTIVKEDESGRVIILDPKAPH